MMYHEVKRESDPSAFIAVKKNRVKQYNKKSENSAYYLEDGQEFQIELYNPRKYHVLAMIHLNGKAISNSGVILKPGQRIFLDRYIDKKKKLKFETYEVPDNEESREAIEYNGDLKIEFFHEDLENNKSSDKNIEEEVEDLRREVDRINRRKKDRGEEPYPFPIPNPSPIPRRPQPWEGPWIWTDSSGDINSSSGTITNATLKNDSGHVEHINMNANAYQNTVKAANFSQNLEFEESSDEGSMETGRVEEGGTSSQEFESVNMKFMKAPISVVEYKLYPASQKPTTSEDLTEVKKYCWSCGAKKKPKFSFCPYCGEKQDQ